MALDRACQVFSLAWRDKKSILIAGLPIGFFSIRNDEGVKNMFKFKNIEKLNNRKRTA